MSALSELSPYVVLIAAGFLPNEIWRMLGIAVAHGLDEQSEPVAVGVPVRVGARRRQRAANKRKA